MAKRTIPLLGWLTLAQGHKTARQKHFLWSDLTFTSQKPGRTIRGLNPEDFLENLSQILKWVFPKNRGTPKSSHSNRVFHYFHHPFWATPIFGNTPNSRQHLSIDSRSESNHRPLCRPSACGAVVEIDSRRQHAHDDHELIAAGRPSQILPAKFQEPSGSNWSCSWWEGEAFPKRKEKNVCESNYTSSYYIE